MASEGHAIGLGGARADMKDEGGHCPYSNNRNKDRPKGGQGAVCGGYMRRVVWCSLRRRPSPPSTITRSAIDGDCIIDISGQQSNNTRHASFCCPMIRDTRTPFKSASSSCPWTTSCFFVVVLLCFFLSFEVAHSTATNQRQEQP